MKIPRRILLISGSMLALSGAVFFLHWLDRPIFDLLALLLHHPEKSSWPLRLHQFSIALFCLGLFLIACSLVLPAWPGFRQRMVDQAR